MPRPAPDRWPQRSRFLELLDAATAAGARLEDIAAALQLKTPRSLEHELRYDRRRRPSRAFLERAAAYFGVDPAELDGQVALDADIAADHRAMGTDLAKLTPEQRAAAVKAWRAVVDAFLAGK